jgi:hypothetical protein
MTGVVNDLRDTRVLIPRIRRAIEGAGVTAKALEDEAVNGLIADAVANIILFTGGLFGHQLNVLERDETYMAPTAWQVDPALSEAEGSLIAIQCQLDYLYQDLKSTKIQETIRDESSEWSYSLSATALGEILKALRAQREEALQQIGEQNGALDAWVNTLMVRDAWTDSLIEPYAVEGGLGGQTFNPYEFG